MGAEVMKMGGLDCLSDPFIQAPAPPAEDPFAGPTVAGPTAAPAQGSAPAGASKPILENTPLAGQPELESVAGGKSALRKGARGAEDRAWGLRLLNVFMMLLGGMLAGVLGVALVRRGFSG